MVAGNLEPSRDPFPEAKSLLYYHSGMSQHTGLICLSIEDEMVGGSRSREPMTGRNEESEKEVHSPRSYLSAVVTRLSIDRLRSARALYSLPCLSFRGGHLHDVAE